MVVLSQQQDLRGMLAEGMRKTERTALPTLVSQQKRIPPIDPLSFYQTGEKLYKGKRVYWASPGEELVLVGLGEAYTFEYEHGNHYHDVEQKWQALVEQAIIDRPSTSPGTGPTLMGGFSFDPQKRKTNLWKDFPDTQLILPRHLLTVQDGEYWLTTNTLLFPEDDVDVLCLHLKEEEQQLLTGERPVLPVWSGGIERIKEVEPDRWKNIVGQVAENIQKGDVDKVVLAREIQLQLTDHVPPEFVLGRFREEQSSSYHFAIENDSSCFVGASPERLIKRTGNQMYTACMAGSIQRGKTEAEDYRLGEWLLQDEKNRDEHAIVVHMIREAMQQTCTEVQAPSQPQLFKTRDIQHLYTPVQGFGSDASLLKVAGQLSPTPALGGFPREVALQRIRDLEHLDRGWYGAPVGWVDHQGEGEFIVSIRSGLLQGDRASLFAGCGIVGDSDPEHEYEETKVKFQPMISALGGSRT